MTLDVVQTAPPRPPARYLGVSVDGDHFCFTCCEGLGGLLAAAERVRFVRLTFTCDSCHTRVRRG